MQSGVLLILLSFMTPMTVQGIVGSDLAYPPSGETIDADEIARQVYFTNHFFAFRNFSTTRRGSTMSVLINSNDGNGMATAVERHVNNHYTNDVDESLLTRDLVIFHSGRMRGAGMLFTTYRDEALSNDYLVWLPEMKRIRRFTQPKHDDAWGGSVFTLGDITLRKLGDETHELIGKKPFRTCLGAIEALEGKLFRYSGKLFDRSCRHLNKEVYGLKSTTKFDNWWYDYRISYVDTESFADYRTLYYKNERLIKVIDRDWGLVKDEGDPRALFWIYWYGLDLRSGKESWVVVPREVVEFNRDQDNTFWTEETLRKIKH